MKSTFLVLVLALTAFGVPCFAAVHLTGTVSADFLAGSSATQSIDTFAAGDQPLFWGLGWEVIMGRVGFGGDYLVSFSRDTGERWWLDWYAPALFLSFHPLGTRFFLDPFLELGVGSSGRVLLDSVRTPTGPGPNQDLSLALFPFAGGGIAFNLEGLLLSVKAVYTPYASPVPATDIPNYPLGKFQVTVSGGISIGG